MVDKKTKPSKLHQALGVLAFAALIAIPILDGFPWFQASDMLFAILALVFLTLMGFGAIVQTILKNR